ncbi:J domain-containing protein [Vibrio owensii]|uniref:J domain-containing protein n=1 Tax=Vibrio owensii TaxID=696485 RepID=UPI00148E3847|nr:J domain-containing protein [Vibrio owensii]
MFEQQFVYKILKKDGNCLAIPTNSFNGFDSIELTALYNQGYVCCSEITATNTNRAIEIYNEMIKSEVVRLNQELSRLQAENYELKRLNENLKRNSAWSHETSGSVRYFELFGFSEFPSPDELKKRYKSLCMRLHPDKQGDKQLFQLINHAYQELNKT